MSHRVYLVPVSAEVVPDPTQATLGLDLDDELSALLEESTVLGISTTAHLDGSLLLVILVET